MIEEITPPPPSAETTLWKGRSSQWKHLGYYLFCLLLAVGIAVAAVMTAGLAAVGLVVPAGMAAWRWLVTRATVYELTSQRLRVTSGILHRKLEELELFRVKDYTMDQPLWLRLFGLGNLTMMTSDLTCPKVVMEAIAGVNEVRETLRNAVQAERDRKRVREMDVDGQGGSASFA